MIFENNVQRLNAVLIVGAIIVWFIWGPNEQPTGNISDGIYCGYVTVGNNAEYVCSDEELK